MITFIIPTIDRPTLKRSLDSLYEQKDPRWKAIIMYDGIKPTTNHTSKQVSCYMIKNKTGNGEGDKYNIHKRNGEAGCVRNCALEHVESEWIGFLDDDDVLTDDYTELLYSKYSEFDLVIFRMYSTTDRAIIPRTERDDDIHFGNVGISFCYKPGKFSKPPRFAYNGQGEDFHFVDDLIKTGCKYTITDEVCYYVRP